MRLPIVAAEAEEEPLVSRVCRLIEDHGTQKGLSPHFLARLIWKESLFDPNAVSPKGAEGIAQFMPGTARLRGLSDPFDIEKAIPAAAEYLAELEDRFGNVGLAAAAYNAGESRVSRWLSNGGFLPLETENYVLDIVGTPADQLIGPGVKVVVPPLDPKKPFDEACRKLPVTARAVTAMASVHTKPWGIQVAGHFRRDVAIRMWERMRRQVPEVLADHRPVVSRARSPRGARGVYAVRIGADSRAEAEKTCERLRSAGGACIVLRNN
nr:lytic transglycosylase domain-containing protein [Chelativorans sp.]